MSKEFDLFWQSTSITKYNARAFGTRLQAYQPPSVMTGLEYPGEPRRLKLPKGKLLDISRKRRSERSFSDKSLNDRELAQIFASFYEINGVGHRGYPAAGGIYVIEIFAVAFNVDGYSGKILHYEPDLHALTIVGDHDLDWNRANESINIRVDGVPQMVVFGVINPALLVDKYGDRGYRFAMLEAGMALQQLSLTVAESKQLKCVASGGAFDDIWPDRLGLNKNSHQLAFCVLVGK